MSKTGLQIGRATGHCRVTGRRLEVGERYIAALLERDDSDELERADFTLEAWETSRPDPNRVFGYWRATVPAPDAKPRLLIDDESMLELFLQSALEEGQTSDPKRLAFRFVLALILIRKRLLVVEGSQGANLLVRPKGVPKPPAGPELIEVADPGLDEARIGELSETLGSLLIGGDAGSEGGSGGEASPGGNP